jgi:hypothetical protein
MKATKRFYTVYAVNIYTSRRGGTHWLSPGRTHTMCSRPVESDTRISSDMSADCWIDYVDGKLASVSDAVTCRQCRNWMLATCVNPTPTR